MMRLLYFPTNCAFAFIFGENIQTSQLIRMVGAPMFFPTRQDAVDAAAFCGLNVDPTGAVSTKFA